MKRTVILIVCCLLLQAATTLMSGVSAQSSATDTLRWVWEVTNTTSTRTKTLTIDYLDSLWVDWGDGTVEWLPDSLSHKTISHVYAQTGNYAVATSANTLSYFKADSRRLLTFDPTMAPRLTYLSCASSQLTSLDLSANTLLQTLYVTSNDLTQLDLSANRKLETLNCSDNQLTALDLSGLPALEKVTCHTNLFTELRVHPTGALNYLSCGACRLDSAALDELFAALPTLLKPISSQNLLFANNPGSEACHPALAVAKGWTLEKPVVPKCVLALPNVSVRAGDTALVSLTLSNPVPVVAFEIDLVLPDGLILDTVRTCLVPARRGQHLLSVATTSATSGQYKLMAYSLTPKDTLKGATGSVVDLYLVATDTLRTYTLDLKKAVLVDTLAKVPDVTLTDGKLTVTARFTPGDADGDLLVNVTDVVWLVAAINGRPPAGFQTAAADMDGNGVLNVVDIVHLVDAIHAAGFDASKPAGYLTTASTPQVPAQGLIPVPSSVRLYQAYEAASSVAGNHVYLRPSGTDVGLVYLCLDNREVVQALQTDVVLPDGYTMQQASCLLSIERAGSHTVSCQPVPGDRGRYRLLLWSMHGDRVFEGHDGALVSFRVQPPASLGVAPDPTAYVDQAVLTGERMNTLSSLTYETLLSVPQAEETVATRVASDAPGQLLIQSGTLDRVRVFTPDGRLVDEVQAPGLTQLRVALKAGVYVVAIAGREGPASYLRAVVR